MISIKMAEIVVSSFVLFTSFFNTLRLMKTENVGYTASIWPGVMFTKVRLSCFLTSIS